MELTIIQQIILGIIQGITEWLPVSSSAMVTIVMSYFYDINDFDYLIKSILLLHLGTFFAALIYFRKDVIILVKSLFNYKNSEKDFQNILKFLIISTLISGFIGLIILKFLLNFEDILSITSKSIIFFVGILLLFTGIIQIKIKKRGLKNEEDINNNDSISLGVAQGISVLPGISRSGITISTLLLKKFDDTTALKLSFLMSLPIVLLGNIFLNLTDFLKIINSTFIYGFLTSFVVGFVTISGLMSLSKKINFGWFVLIFALLMLGSLMV
jgi:undecaprenyl-diphosphatase